MTEYKSHRVKRENLPAEKPICVIDTRAVYLILFSWGVAFLFLILKNVLAVLLIFVAIVISARKPKVLYLGYEDRFVYMNKDDPQYCNVIYLSEIKGWEYRITNNGDKLILYLEDGEVIKISEKMVRSLYNYFHKVLPDREVRKNTKA